ncbi:MAG: SPOR domain-containing protein [Pseudomonadota bacterium]
MASNSVLKAARSSDIPETDPLAELSRIMGLAKEEAAANSSGGDFEIDLEQELMGEFLRDDAEAQPQALAPQVAEEETGSLETDFEDAFADMLAETGEAQEPEAVEVPEPEPAAAMEELDVDLKAREATIEDDLADLDAAFEGFDLTAAEDDQAPEYLPEEVEEELFDDASVFDEPSPVAQAPDEVAPEAIEADEPRAMIAPDIAPAPMAASAALSIEDELRALLGQVKIPDVPAAEATAQDDRAESRSQIFEKAAEPASAAVADAVSDVEFEFSEDDFAVEQPEPAHDEMIGRSDADTGEELVAQVDEEFVAQADEELATEMPSFDDFSFDEADFDTAGLASALAETLAEDETAHAAEEPEATQHIATEAEAALNPAERTEAVSEASDDMGIDLEAELATFSDKANDPARSAANERPAPEPVGLRPLTFPGERAATTERPAAPAFDWRKRYAEMKSTEPARSAAVAEQAAAPKTESAFDDADPFAALAALAAQPPILRSLGRSNPVAMTPVAAERAPAHPAAVAAPTPVVEKPAVAATPAASAPPFSSWRTQNAPSDPAPRASAAPKPALPEPAIPQRGATGQTGPLFPVSRSDTSFQPLRPGPAAPAGAATASSIFAARPSIATPAASTAPAALAPTPTGATRVAQQPVDDEFPDLAALLDDANLAPDIDTIEFSDDAVALADELDIPDIARDEPVTASSPYDDLDADFANAFQQLSATPAPRATQPAYRPAAQPDPGAAYYVERATAPARDAHANRPAAQSSLNAQEPEYDEQLIGFDMDQSTAAYADDDDVAFASDFYGVDAEKEQPKRSRGLLIAAALAGVVVIGGIGAYALSGGSTGDDAPALVKADTTPVKVKPETPGGVVVPNQDGQVYDQVRGQPAAAPSQDKLVSGAEEPIAAPAAPVAVEPATGEQPVAAAPAASALPGVETPQVKSEERVTPQDSAQTAPQSQDVVAIAPKKVRTMIVRPDGTLVAREDPPAASAETTGTAMQTMPAGADPATMANVQSGAQIPSAVPGAQDEVSILPPENAAESASDLQTPAPTDVIVPMPRPSHTATAATEEPVRQAAATPAPVRSEPAPQPAAPAAQETSAPAATTPVAANLWSVQIASQPTREGAQSSYEDLARRYGSVLGGKGVNIIQAEVTGKGTMWRVRVPAASKNDANILCAKLKTAGGSCFVTQ